MHHENTLKIPCINNQFSVQNMQLYVIFRVKIIDFGLGFDKSEHQPIITNIVKFRFLMVFAGSKTA